MQTMPLQDHEFTKTEAAKFDHKHLVSNAKNHQKSPLLDMSSSLNFPLFLPTFYLSFHALYSLVLCLSQVSANLIKCHRPHTKLSSPALPTVPSLPTTLPPAPLLPTSPTAGHPDGDLPSPEKPSLQLPTSPPQPVPVQSTSITGGPPPPSTTSLSLSLSHLSLQLPTSRSSSPVDFPAVFMRSHSHLGMS